MFGLFKSSTWSRCVKGSFTAFRRRCVSHSRRFIGENTEVVGEQSLTPELRLRLFTPSCRFWTERPELWPYEDPYWAIYWPGGQALSRFLLDHPAVCRGQTVLDLGSGCGASAIAAILCGAAHVVANDIDPMAAVATHMNSELNGLQPPVCLTHNIMGSPPSLATSLHTWLNRCMETHGTKVGDPGRAQFESTVREENYGLSCSGVWSYTPEL
uniref:Electron transfer flavoprotein beta subunit lysine methyltransferase n=1 Tax=Labrus bergylta TaxID=56723 RepID=A0A3Q3FST0_9LABR